METELKLDAMSCEDPPSILRDPWLIRHMLPESERRIDMFSRYYDTPRRTLSARHASLRLREENEERIVTVKAGRAADSGLHQRLEWSVILEEGDPDPFTVLRDGFDIHWFMRLATSDGDPGDLLYELLSLIEGEAIQEVCRVDFTRMACDIGYGDTLMELAYDEGELLAGGLREPVCEIELELREGDARDLTELGDELMARYGLTPENRSKYERCLRLLEQSQGDHA